MKFTIIKDGKPYKTRFSHRMANYKKLWLEDRGHKVEVVESE